VKFDNGEGVDDIVTGRIDGNGEVVVEGKDLLSGDSGVGVIREEEEVEEEGVVVFKCFGERSDDETNAGEDVAVVDGDGDEVVDGDGVAAMAGVALAQMGVGGFCRPKGL
jgi:archaeosine-15-forming tRNA-guanine transglycosylase